MHKLIIANWKLNPTTLDEAKALAEHINEISPYEVVICPPQAFLSSVKYRHVGAQDVGTEVKGAFTGQTSAAQLASLNIEYCLVGHSERRALGENDIAANEKIKKLLQYKIRPVLCIGYATSVEQDELEVIDVLGLQLKNGLNGVDPAHVIVAYEPVWAIGSGKPATPEHAEQVALYIKTKFGVNKVLYGGSINSSNSEKFLAQHNVDGLLVGGASLLAEDFNKIISN